MQRALAEAERGRGAVEPNPMVGSVVVRDGRLVGFGHHTQFGAPHAEVEALRRAGDAARGATLYVTLEPCCHIGKTPPCTEAILAAGVTRVVAAMPDPFPKVAGGGLARLREAGVVVEQGLEAAAAEHLNAPYLKRLSTGRPYVTAKWAMTLDGKTATASGDSRWISGPRSRALVHEVRGRMDAIVVGIGTALADDPELTARPPGPRVPARVVLDGAGRLPTTSRLTRTAREVPVLVALTERATPERREALAALGCEVILFPGEGPVPILPLLDELGRRGMTNLLVEGGGRILGAFLDAGQVDAVDVFIAPLIEGGQSRFTPAQGEGRSRMADALRLARPQVSLVDGDLRLQGILPPSWHRAECP
ncbi:bifunctional diaminohydroxyphosphoribosylaminopyrimidine deaminase/5-amino-6-(5-phosphoribosylamino)uracil reductase RibD [Singulisphaera sp. GP187]|uniref:bifunctional diaminohydroxyphosphoribosylaminopyrimidine deaminase/5-amino-6-(5-phosphoribosylamino)uracil reductase RibD n=1 Tax=Singulisphaera sp. GP187 TaxID=1882752 RepID=UPI0009417CAB|nr:bifunctional diaminohydroxyphosphoribosylaminopyrimidine deaminase/5-amino-6-(5-phosphoribosylamino)uracil reductase RibD [Singulisphaera sp. GP187]